MACLHGNLVKRKKGLIKLNHAGRSGRRKYVYLCPWGRTIGDLGTGKKDLIRNRVPSFIGALVDVTPVIQSLLGQQRGIKVDLSTSCTSDTGVYKGLLHLAPNRKGLS